MPCHSEGQQNKFSNAFTFIFLIFNFCREGGKQDHGRTEIQNRKQNASHSVDLYIHFTQRKCERKQEFLAICLIVVVMHTGSRKEM